MGSSLPDLIDRTLISSFHNHEFQVNGKMLGKMEELGLDQTYKDLHKEYGLYFVMSTQNEGFNDLSQAVGLVWYTLPMFLSDLSKDRLPSFVKAVMSNSGTNEEMKDVMLKSGVKDPALEHWIPAMQLHLLYQLIKVLSKYFQSCPWNGMECNMTFNGP
ncbi:hypothetical protein SELMODRAFT_431931 [Selaginella moellendorffii]|uniref:Uncharacterized protein n=1 Tax=Selaginella moellendorffii TaxID=88036 RepID=D8TEF1_SELML|nr:hypothetical protein SELMODRAFT_431931 [Selaginella moellendorffii]